MHKATKCLNGATTISCFRKNPLKARPNPTEETKVAARPAISTSIDSQHHRSRNAASKGNSPTIKVKLYLQDVSSGSSNGSNTSHVALHVDGGVEGGGSSSTGSTGGSLGGQRGGSASGGRALSAAGASGRGGRATSGGGGGGRGRGRAGAGAGSSGGAAGAGAVGGRSRGGGAGGRGRGGSLNWGHLDGVAGGRALGDDGIGDGWLDC